MFTQNIQKYLVFEINKIKQIEVFTLKSFMLSNQFTGSFKIL